MTSSFLRSATVAVLALAVGNLGFVGTARAGIVATAEFVQTDRAANLASIQAQLDRADVRAQMEKLGVDSNAIGQRIASLSDSEVHALAGKMENAPAGGSVLVLIGATFLILMILEFVGVIDIFKKVP
jgi:hypothetical protein